MPLFIYKSRKPGGEAHSGEREAKDRFELYKILRDGGEEVLSVRERSVPAPDSLLSKFMGGFIGSSFKLKTQEKIVFARNLGSMLEAGLPLSRAISVSERESKNKKFKSLMQSILLDLNAGEMFSRALAKHPKVFPSLFVSMVHAGEQGGTLAEALKAIATQMDKVYQLEKRVKGALMYPAVIVLAMIIVGILMFIFVIPTLMETFTELDVKLPATTQFVLDLSNLMKDQGLLVLAVVLIFGGIMYWSSKKDIGKKIFHLWSLKMPIIGPLVREVNSARTARTLSSLFQSGVDVVESVDITSKVVQNVYFRKVLADAREAIKKGALMSKVFADNNNTYPIFFAEMLAVGEETGRMSDMLINVAHYYEEDVEQKTKDMSTVIEPFLILLIGGAVGFFAVSMISPMYSLVNAI